MAMNFGHSECNGVQKARDIFMICAIRACAITMVDTLNTYCQYMLGTLYQETLSILLLTIFLFTLCATYQF